MIPHRTPFLLPLLYPSLLWRMPADTNTIFLTFDDGPVPGPTEFVIETLARNNVPATFFCIGDNVLKHPEIFRRLVSGGHAIGNHTFNHLNGWKTRNSVYLQNIQQLEQLFQARGYAFTGKLFRPPYGQVSRAQIRMLKDFRIVMWDALSQDYNRYLTPEKCLRRTIAATRAGSIVVFHDSVKAERNMVYTLPRLIDHFMDKGFQFSALKFAS